LLQIGANEYKWVQNAKVSSNTATIFTFLNLSRIREHYKFLLYLNYNNVSLKEHIGIVMLLLRDKLT